MNPVGDQRNGKGSAILGTHVNDPIASDFAKSILYPEKTLNDEMTLIRQGTEVWGV